MTIREFRLLPALLVLPATLVLSAVTAEAAGGGVAQVVGTQLRYTAAPGDANNIIISKVGDVHFVDDVVPIVPGPGCAFVTPNDNTIVGCANPGIRLLLVNGGDGNDIMDNETSIQSIMNGADGNDTMRGGDNVDHMNGDNGDDELRGAPGNDNLLGSAGNDKLIGNPGDDRLNGGSGSDTLRGDNGNDIMRGDDGDDLLNGSDGDDSLDGNSGTNRLDGGAHVRGDTCVNGPTIINCNP